jgi:vacuolar-type H+-ATPase subunit H
VYHLLESFKAVLEKEREAEKVILEARLKAEKIRKTAQKKVEDVYRETHERIIAEARLTSIKIKEQAKKDAESEAQFFIKRAEKLKKKILASAEQQFHEAINSILHEILH